MRTFKATIILLLLVVTVGFSQHPSFSYKRKLMPVTAEGWYTIAVPGAMFSHIDNSFDDIRIYSISEKDTVEIPYILKVSYDQTSSETVDLPVLNKSRKDGKLFFSCNTNGKPINYVDLQFAQKNFNAFVNIEGSYDQKNWFELVNDQRILSINTASVQYQTTQVSFPISNYMFIRFSIKSDVVLDLLQASFKNQTTKAGVTNSYKTSFTVKEERQSKQTIIDIILNDFAPINKIMIDAKSDLDFYRSFNLEYVSDSSKTPKGWTVFYSTLYSGYITSINENTFPFDLHNAKKLRLTINNQDNAPLSIADITAAGPQVSLISKLKPANNFLFYGNEKIGMPDYDLVHFENNIPDSLSSVPLESEENIQQPVVTNTQPLFNSKFWLWAIMTIAIGVLGFFTLKMLREK
jgi:hypothetical protein